MDRETSLKELKAPDASARRRAARALASWDDTEVFGALAGALGDAERDVREAASEALLQSGDSRAVRFLVPLLQSDVPAVRNSVCRVLERLGRVEPQALVTLSQDSDPRMRIFAANIMAGTGDHDLAPRLLGMIDDADESVRDAAIVALGRIRAPEAVDRLSACLGGGHSWMQFSVIDALSKIGGAGATAALIKALPAVGTDLREPLVDAVAQQAEPASVEPLVGLLVVNPDLRPTILRVLLGPLWGPLTSFARSAASRVFMGVLAEEQKQGRLPPTLALAALEFHESVGESREGSFVLRALESSDREVQAAALRLCVRLRQADAVPVLRRMLGDSDPEFRKEILAGIAEIGFSGKERA